MELGQQNQGIWSYQGTDLKSWAYGCRTKSWGWVSLERILGSTFPTSFFPSAHLDFQIISFFGNAFQLSYSRKGSKTRFTTIWKSLKCDFSLSLISDNFPQRKPTWLLEPWSFIGKLLSNRNWGISSTSEKGALLTVYFPKFTDRQKIERIRRVMTDGILVTASTI